MGHFNKKSIGTKTTNLAGGEAYKEDAKLELVSILLTSFLKNTFYRSEDKTAQRLKELVEKVDSKFAAKAAIYARTKYGMRSVSHLVAGEIANNVKGQTWTRSFFDKIVKRPDDITEIIAYYGNTYGFPLPNSAKKGFAVALTRFDEYTLAKYKMEGSDVKLVDAINLVHPKETPAIRKLIRGELKAAQTWEVKLSDAGQKAETKEELEDLKEQAWKDLILEKKLGYFALLRNLRNIRDQAPEVLPQALEMLRDEKLIKKSLVMPFRYITAVKEFHNASGSREIVSALNDAVEISLNNVPEFQGKTLIVLDVSGSMLSAVSGTARWAEIGAIFGGVLYKVNQGADFMTFDNEARYVTLNPKDSLLTLTRSIPFSGGGTDFRSIFRAINQPYDRIIILSDMQGWMGYHAPTSDWIAYQKKYNCTTKIYSFDLAGLGTLQFPQANVFCLAGFSDKTMDILTKLEEDKNALVNEIEAVEL